ncbi:MAG: hemolysin III family protein [Gaiellaceae bacterium]
MEVEATVSEGAYGEVLEARAAARVKPRLRGISHQVGFFASIPLGVALVVAVDGGVARLAAAIFATSVTAMFGASAFYHRPTWSPAQRSRLRRLDHAGIFGLIAGSYTPFGLLVLTGGWRVVVLSIVWAGSAVSIVLRLFWGSMPKWVTAAIAVTLGWVAVAAFPLIVARIGPAASTLLFTGGACYTLGALVYASRRPDWWPATFGYHEVFHALVVVAVACQYTAVAFFILPRG